MASGPPAPAQHPTVPGELAQDGRDRSDARHRDAEPGGEPGSDLLARLDRGQVDRPHAVGERGRHVASDVRGEAGLAATRRSHHRDQAVLGQERTDPPEFHGPSDQP